MKVNILDAHDRLQHFSNQSVGIDECVNNFMKNPPFGDVPFYLFVHTRTLGLDEKIDLYSRGRHIFPSIDKVPEKRLIWQPRLTKPKAQENSMLFKLYPKTQEIKILWILPQMEMWDEYKKRNLLQSEIVFNSIEDYKYRRKKLESIEEDDLTDEQIDAIYKQISNEAKRKSSKPEFEVSYLPS